MLQSSLGHSSHGIRVEEYKRPTFEVEFDPEWGGPGLVRWDALKLWNENDDDRVKYYSGTAVYRTQFQLDAEFAESDDITLKLGTVHDIARVKVNGIDCGIAWKQPYDVRIEPAVKEGANLLEIEVVNCWQNRLIGDAALPPEERYTQTNVVLERASGAPMPRYRGYLSTDTLEPSGLLGPLELEAR